MRLSRADADRRLLRAAIKGFVLVHDSLVVHLCAQSAFRICRDIVKSRFPDRDLLGGLLEPYLPQFLRSFSDLNNFLKHADRGAEEIEVKGLHDRNASLIFASCRYFEAAFGVACDEPSIILFQAYRHKCDPLSRPEAVADLDPTLAELDANQILTMLE